MKNKLVRAVAKSINEDIQYGVTIHSDFGSKDDVRIKVVGARVRNGKLQLQPVGKPFENARGHLYTGDSQCKLTGPSAYGITRF